MTQAAFDRLAPFVQEFIYRQEWAGLRPLQVASIEAIMDGDQDILITTGTASGKTEAAFLPILSLISMNPIGSVKGLYVGPLKALINDQFRRLDIVCEQGGIPIHRWHGDVAANKKTDMVEHPGGILQITPESLESLLINKTKSLRRLFGGLEFIVVDEVHTFLESDRGLQLQCQMERISAYAAKRPRRIGLSATVGDVDVAKGWLNAKSPESVLLINPEVNVPPVRLSHKHFVTKDGDLPPELLDDLYMLTRNHRTLIFCNSRRNVEVVTAELNKRCRRDRLDDRYLPHHGSISKELREDAESRMRDADRPFTVVCTNTLELGIDIGQLEYAVQIDSTHSVMSFVQRLGRTGRQEGAARIMQMYTTKVLDGKDEPFFEVFPYSMLKACAVVDLFLEGWIEPPVNRSRSYNVLYHQMMSRLLEKNGATPRDLVKFFAQCGVFGSVSPDDYALFLKHLAGIDHIEQMETGELIVGLEGEKLARSREFYAVFQSAPELEVLHGERNIGRISPSPDLVPGVCLLLGGKVWKVVEILSDQKQVLVNPAPDSRDVLFSGTGVPEMHPAIAQRVRDILNSDMTPRQLDETGKRYLADARKLFQGMGLTGTQIVEAEDSWIVFLWTGTKIARTFQMLVSQAGLESNFANQLFPWVLVIKRPSSGEAWAGTIELIRESASNIGSTEELLGNVAEGLLLTHKFDELVPIALIRKRACDEWIDWEGAKQLLAGLLDQQPFSIESGFWERSEPRYE